LAQPRQSLGHHALGARIHELTPATDDYVLAKPGEVYAIYVPRGGAATLDLENSEGGFAVQWFNPRAGGELAEGSVTSVSGPGIKPLGEAPQNADADWVILVKKEP
jgi:hypothetical protein